MLPASFGYVCKEATDSVAGLFGIVRTDWRDLARHEINCVGKGPRQTMDSGSSSMARLDNDQPRRHGWRTCRRALSQNVIMSGPRVVGAVYRKCVVRGWPLNATDQSGQMSFLSWQSVFINDPMECNC